MYLAGFSLTLVFVIPRLVELMQQVLNIEEERDSLEQRIQDMGDAAAKSTITTDNSGPIETTLRKRPNASVITDKKD